MNLLLHQLSLDDHLGGDAGVIGPRLPQHVLPAHALEADHDVLQRVVQRVPHVQGAGDVGRRYDNGEGLGTVLRTSAGAEGIGLLPGSGDLGLDAPGVIGLFKHGKGVRTVGILLMV